jgi:hypothetical protein
MIEAQAMAACAAAASAAAAACTPVASVGVQATFHDITIPPEKILEWCFFMGSLDLAVFGFAYATYANATFDEAFPPPIVDFLKSFCWLLVAVLIVLAGLAGYIANQANISGPVWVIIGCLGIVVFASAVLAYEMD